MPLVREENGSISIVYNLPEELKGLITKEFATTMINEIESVWQYTQENILDMVGILYMQGGTCGIDDAFKATCDKLGLIKFKEESKLDWYDYDLFMDEMLDIVGKVFFGKENYIKLCNEFMEEYTKGEKEAKEVGDKSNIEYHLEGNKI